MKNSITSILAAAAITSSAPACDANTPVKPVPVKAVNFEFAQDIEKLSGLQEKISKLDPQNFDANEACSLAWSFQQAVLDVYTKHNWDRADKQADNPNKVLEMWIGMPEDLIPKEEKQTMSEIHTSAAFPESELQNMRCIGTMNPEATDEIGENRGYFECKTRSMNGEMPSTRFITRYGGNSIAEYTNPNNLLSDLRIVNKNVSVAIEGTNFKLKTNCPTIGPEALGAVIEKEVNFAKEIISE